MVIHTLFEIQRHSSPMAFGDNHGHPHPLCYLETIKFGGTWGEITVIHTLFAIQRKSSPMAHGDKTWSSAPFLLSRDNQVHWHAKTKHDHSHPLCYLETIMFDCTQRQNMVIRTFFSIQRQSSPMARREKHGHPHHFGNTEIVMSEGTRRQNMVIRTISATRDNQV